MKILSFDIGIKNLAFCLIDNNKMYEWDIINLLEGENKINCKYQNCENKVFYIYNNVHYCKKHINKDQLVLFSKEHLISNIKKKNNNELNHLIKTLNLEMSKTKKSNIETIKTFYEENSYKPYKKQNCNSIDLIKIGINLKNMLDKLIMFDYDLVLIENQIGPLANRMKTLQGMVTQYFIMKNKEVKYVSSQNKLKFLKVEKNKLNYKQRKQLAIDSVPEILEKIDFSNYISFYINNNKKDDLADCLLQAWSYIHS